MSCQVKVVMQMDLWFHFRFLCKMKLKVTHFSENKPLLSCFECDLKGNFPWLFLPLHNTWKKNRSEELTYFQQEKKKKLFIIRESSCRRTLPTSDEAGSACRIHTGRRHSGKFTTYQYSSWVDFSSYFISIKSTLGSLNGLWGFISARAGLEFSKI